MCNKNKGEMIPKELGGWFCHALAMKLPKPHELTQVNLKTYEREPQTD